MPHPRPCLSTVPAPDERTYRVEAALRNVRRLAPEELDVLVRRWLTARRLRAICRWNPRDVPPTYGAVLDEGGFSLPVHVRVHRRRNRLQYHHVEAFLGHLDRTGASAGILVSTGDAEPRALLSTRSLNAPQVQLLTGADWLLELARCGVRVPGITAPHRSACGLGERTQSS